MRILLKNLKVVTPFRIAEAEDILIEGRKIKELRRDINEKEADIIFDLSGKIATPGFVDLHVHGAMNHDFTEATEESIQEIVKHFLRHGTTGLLATLYTKPKEMLIQDIRNIVRYMEWGEADRTVMGIHIEGPFINPEMHGAMRKDYVWRPSLEDWYLLRDAGRNYIKLMTIAPEVEGSMEIIRDASLHGIVPSLGHSKAPFDLIEEAIDNGMAHVTHIFNAMEPLHHRKPGVLTAALLRDELKVQLIGDGFHIHPAIIKLLYKLKGHTGIILITDAIRVAGMPDGEYTFSGQRVFIKEGKVVLEDGTLAGSSLTLDRAVKNMVKLCDIPLTHAVRMASLNPIRVLGKEHRKGILAVGKDADIVIMDEDFNVLMTIQEGNVRFNALEG